jgi:hypothetical protein
LKQDPHEPERLNWWPKDWGAKHCTLEETDRYVRSPYRGIKYFAAMPERQQSAVGALVRHLCELFNIPREADKEARKGVYNLRKFQHYKGVASHTNFRRDKWDVGPAFDWDRLGF